jgi:hypothetical protein
VIRASASPANPSCDTLTTPSPATCRTHAEGLRPIASLIKERFSSTAAGSSPTFREMFKLSYGSFETPPRRVKNQIRAPSGSGSGVM